MRQYLISTALLLFAASATASSAQQDIETLIEKPDPAIQAQLQRVLNALQKPGVEPGSDLDVCREVQTLKKLNPDQDRLVKQLAIFVATANKADETNTGEATPVFIMQVMLQVLDFPPRVPIRALAPFLDVDNPQLRESVRLWFRLHDTAGTDNGGTPPIKPVNYEDYVEYVESKVTHKEEVPTPFVKYIFESSAGRALLVFAYANSPNIHIVAGPQKLTAMVQAEKTKLREIELAEHIVSNAIWLQKNKFDDRFQAALPEANEQLDKLAQRKEWWAKLYVVYIMRQNPPLLRDNVLRKLAEDENKLVNEAAKSARGQ